MIISRKSIFRTVLLISLTIVTLVYGVTYPIDIEDVDTKTMCSKLFDNLYVTGDLLHINRATGGYSLQLCWTTGYLAGVSAASD